MLEYVHTIGMSHYKGGLPELGLRNWLPRTICSELGHRNWLPIIIVLASCLGSIVAIRQTHVFMVWSRQGSCHFQHSIKKKAGLWTLNKLLYVCDAEETQGPCFTATYYRQVLPTYIRSLIPELSPPRTLWLSWTALGMQLFTVGFQWEQLYLAENYSYSTISKRPPSLWANPDVNSKEPPWEPPWKLFLATTPDSRCSSYVHSNNGRVFPPLKWSCFSQKDCLRNGHVFPGKTASEILKGTYGQNISPRVQSTLQHLHSPGTVLTISNWLDGGQAPPNLPVCM